jgi:hypothetical protein
MRALLLAAVLATTFQLPAQAQINFSANAILPGCRDMLAVNKGATIPTARFLELAECRGMFRTIIRLGASLDPKLSFCPPVAVTYTQAIEIAMREIEAHPERWHEDFISLAINIFHRMWPCR